MTGAGDYSSPQAMGLVGPPTHEDTRNRAQRLAGLKFFFERWRPIAFSTSSTSTCHLRPPSPVSEMSANLPQVGCMY